MSHSTIHWLTLPGSPDVAMPNRLPCPRRKLAGPRPATTSYDEAGIENKSQIIDEASGRSFFGPHCAWRGARACIERRLSGFESESMIMDRPVACNFFSE